MVKDHTVAISDPLEFLNQQFMEYRLVRKDAATRLYDGYYWPRNRVFKFVVDQFIANIPIVGLFVLAVVSVTKPFRKHKLTAHLAPVGPAELLKALDKRYAIRDLIEKTQSTFDPEGSQLDLSICEEWIGDILLQLGRRETALDHFRKARAIREKLAADDPSDVEKRRVLDLIIDREQAAQRSSGPTAFSSHQRISDEDIDRVIERSKRPFAERVGVLHGKG